MYYGECIRNDSEGIANLFNEHFFNQFSDKSKYDIDMYFDKDPWFDFSISESTICNLLRSLNPNKSKGPDDISGHLFKACAMSISFPLQILFNNSFKTGSMPLEWKMANIVPIHKKGDKCCIENYRPISLTCIVSKIFEKCLRDEIPNYCKDSLHDTQHCIFVYFILFTT